MLLRHPDEPHKTTTMTTIMTMTVTMTGQARETQPKQTHDEPNLCSPNPKQEAPSPSNTQTSKTPKDPHPNSQPRCQANPPTEQNDQKITGLSQTKPINQTDCLCHQNYRHPSMKSDSTSPSIHRTRHGANPKQESQSLIQKATRRRQNKSRCWKTTS